jgi:hypothetical protein
MSITTLKSKYEDVIKESPLGFYYKTVEKIQYEEETNLEVVVKYHVVYIHLYETTFKIKYPVECNDIKIGFDARPWDICIGDMSIQEHIIKSLQKLLDDIFTKAAPIKHWERTKEKVYSELFGNKNGYTTVSNDIKIVSHGFDPKESFRKRKKISFKKCNIRKDTE